jgi:activator of HSP90 ATPase
MPKNVVLAAYLPAKPDRLFDMYLDSTLHAAFTGAPMRIDPHPGGVFKAFDGVLTGTVLHIAPKRVIAQTWRSQNWPDTAIDSILVLTFWPEGDGARIELNQVNVPEEDFAGVCQGWEKFYWTPWRAYLEKQSGQPAR